MQRRLIEILDNASCRSLSTTCASMSDPLGCSRLHQPRRSPPAPHKVPSLVGRCVQTAGVTGSALPRPARLRVDVGGHCRRPAARADAPAAPQDADGGDALPARDLGTASGSSTGHEASMLAIVACARSGTSRASSVQNGSLLLRRDPRAPVTSVPIESEILGRG